MGRIFLLLAGLVLLALALPPFFSFPWLGFWLVPLAMIYLFMLLIIPRLWLIVLPLATVGLDLAPWTGRFAYNELDLLFLVTLASGLLYGRYRFRVFSPGPAVIVLLLYLLVIAFGYRGWTFLVLPPVAAFDNPYYTSEYTYKVLKGMLWGLSLVPMWGYLLAADKKRTVTVLVTGMTLAALVLGLTVLWERGTLGVVLSGAPWYHVVSSLLDLSSSYRVTGLLSDMHTGGEAYDGVVLLLVPATLYAAIYGRRLWLRLLGAAGLLVLAYVTLVGFTRATYAAFALALVTYFALSIILRRNNGMPPAFPLVGSLAALGAGIFAALISYRFAGIYGLASYCGLLLLAYTACRMQLPGWTRHAVTGLAVALVALAINAHFSSRWVEPSITGVLLITAGLAASFVTALKAFAKLGAAGEINRLFILAGILVLPTVFAFALGGYQINDRFTRISGDLKTRENHWRDVIESADSDFFHRWLGNGVGSFPASYIARHPQRVKDVGSFSIVGAQQRDVLEVGGGKDLMIAQRVTIEPHSLYTVGVNLRAEQPGLLGIALCERNLIYASNFMPRCVSSGIRFEATDGAFEHLTVEIDSGNIGERGPLRRWPTVLDLRYGKPGAVVEIDAVEFSADGFNLLRNSSFKQGLDYWFSYNDYAHLPWHVKNTFLQVWFETGWLGLALFLILLVLLLRSNFAHHAHDSLQPVYTTAVVAVCLFGLFGSPLDSARVSWMFYFFMAAGLARLRAHHETGPGYLVLGRPLSSTTSSHRGRHTTR